MVNNLSGKFVLAITGLLTLFVVVRCSPINPSINKNLIQAGDSGAVLKPAVTIIKVRDDEGKVEAAEESNSRVVELSGEQILELKNEGKTKVHVDGVARHQTTAFNQASFRVSDHAESAKTFDIEVSRSNRASRDEWTVSIPESVDAQSAKQFLSALDKVELTFSIRARWN
jgi:hypothetical protein